MTRTVTSDAFHPPLVDDLGQAVNVNQEDSIEAHEPGVSSAYATAALGPQGWNRGQPDSSRMVGWTLHQGRSVVQQHAFSINPQSITRNPTSRNQLFATQGGFFVDDFGPGPETIQLTQFVAHGRATPGGGGSIQRATARQDVIRFWDLIWSKAVQNPGQYQVYFHDNHLWNQVSGRTPELVYFPSQQSFQLSRSVQQHNVWLLQLTMITLQQAPATTGRTSRVPGTPNIKVHVVKSGETLKRIAAKLAGRHPTHKRTLALERQIIALTARYGKDDITKNRDVPIYSSTNPQHWLGNKHVTRMHLAPGEKIILPAG